MPKNSEYKKEDIINAIVEMRLVKCMSIKNVLDFLMNDLGYGQAMAYNYIKMAQDVTVTNYNEVHKVASEEAFGQIENMMQYAMTNKNFKLWFELRKEMNKLQGLYATQKVDVTTNGENINTTIINIINPNGDNIQTK